MKKQILIIDFEPNILELLNYILCEEYRVVLKANCYDALLWLENRPNPDLILLDPDMPCFSGIDFIKSLKISGLYRHIPIVVLTKEKLSSLSMNLLLELTQGAIQKPFNPTMLKEKLENILSFQNNNYELGRYYN